MTKTCRKCGVDRPVGCYHANRNSAEGLSRDCKACRAPAKFRRDKMLARGFRECSGCGAVKEVTEFHSDSSKVVGLSPRCKPCKRAFDMSRDRSKRHASHKRWRRSSPGRMLANACRCRLSGLVRRKNLGSRQASTQQLVGCTWDELAAHIERHFQPGMSWDNRGEWQLDHHIPLAAFYDGPAGEHWIEVACHWTNLKPMWGAENASKNGRLPEGVFVP